MTDGERFILEAVGRLTDIMVELTLSIQALQALVPPIWACGCGHVNGVNLAVCAQCGRAPSDTTTRLEHTQ
jgi:hypothetical protein